ncbi:NAD-dependent epimerase/dehydratase family protein [Emticicia agri]|uniref:NAD-dependent epimerase/dehydratase family protein n=1 Tax=Emticicia agri TaxID=2492393 RepID=A0A4Q5LX81_9BACT|nr:NAD-dependent epimerase/dehydratase family protein [Emticicia agri]RYU94354.1 NAD-dependent epimerase/dehydratase family protein [Emticicia agri]
MKTILITGASGFVGKNFIKAFSSKFLIKVISLRKMPVDNINLQGIDVIIHLAGKAHDLKKNSKPSEYYEVNTELTKKIYDKFLESNASTFITLSSVKAAADKILVPLTEETIPEPETHYGKSKLLAEKYIFSRPLSYDKQVYVLRPCIIHGEGNKGNLNLLYQLVKRGFPYPLGSFENKRSFLSIENLNFIFEQLINRKDIPSGIYNVSDENPLSTNKLIYIMGKSLNKKIKIFYINPSIIKYIAKIGNILHLPLNEERLQKMTENYIVDNTKILNALKHSLPVSSEEGLKRTFQTFINEKL